MVRYLPSSKGGEEAESGGHIERGGGGGGGGGGGEDGALPSAQPREHRGQLATTFS